MFRRGDRNTRKFRNKKIRKSLGRLASFGGWMRKPSLEFLEERRVLSTLTWVGDVDANWNTDNAGDTNWNTNTLPADGDTLVFPAGAANINNNNDTTAGNSYILQFTGTNYTVSGNAITLDLPGVDIVGNTQTVIGTNFTLAADTTVQVNGGPAQTQLNGILSGATGGLTKTGTNFLTLTGTNNYAGATDVQQGFLVLGLGGSITSSNAVTIQSGASLGTATGDAGAANAPIDGKAGSTIQADPGATLTLGTAASAAGFSTDGNISIGNNATVTLNDSDNAVLGPSTSLGGGTATLIAANGVALSAGDVLSGNGTVQGAINVGAGTISPGSSAGDINVTGNVTFGATGTYAAELDGVAAGQFDTLDITGSATLNGAKLNLAGSGHIPVAGNSFVILTTTAGITGNFSDAGGNPLPEGANVFVNGRALSVSYLGNNVTLTFDATPVINAGAGNNGIEVREDAGGNIEVVVDGNTVLDQPLASLTNLTINGEGGDDTLTMNYGAAGGFFNLPVMFNGGANGGTGDSLVINDAPGTATTVTHTFINANNGSVNIDGTVISYTGLEPVIDNLGAVNRVFDFTGAGETITLDTAGALDNQIRSTLGESVDFTNPTATLTILTTSAAGADIVNIEGVDAALDADLIITAKATDTVNFQTAATDIGTGDFSVTAGTINVNQPISTTSVAALAVDLSATTISFSATGAINATGSGEVEITAAAGGITMADGSVVNAGSGVIDIDSLGAFQVGRLVTTNNTAAAIDINSGAITDAGDIGGDDIEATGALAVVTIVSTGAVGTAVNPVETNVNSLNVDTTAANGNQFLTEANGLTDLNLNAGLGDVTLVLTAGGITDTAADGDDITALNATVTLNGAGNVGALGNDVETSVDSLTVNTSAAGGNQFLTEANGLTDLDLNAGAGNINLTLAAGGILDNAGDGNDVVGSDAIIISQDGIGFFGNPIETDLVNLDVTNNAFFTVGIFIEDTGDGLTLADLNGDLLSVNGYGGAGEIRANSPLTFAANAITFGGMTYTAADSAVAGDDLTVNAGITVNDFTSFLTMNGGDDVIFNLGSNVTAAMLLTINGDFGNLDAGVGSNINLFGVIGGTAFPDAIVITGDTDDDVISIDDNAGVLGDGGTVSSVVTGFGGLNINGFGGADTLNLDDFGDATADTFSITDTTISAGFADNYFDGMPVGTGLTYAGLETINLQTSNLVPAANGDVVTVFSLNAGTTYNLDGNDPLVLPGDILNLNPVGPIDMYEVAGVYEFDFGGSGNLNATEFETINLIPGNGVLNIIGDEGQGTLNGGAGIDEADLVVVTGTGANAGQVQLGHGGVLIAVPPQVNFAGVFDLNINTFDLDDQITITPFATAIQPWNIEVDVDGGAQAVSDRLTYNNVATVFDDTSLVATGLGSGRFDAPGIGSATTNEVVTFTGVEDVTANANPGDDDHVTLELPSTDDTATFLFDPDAGDDDIQLTGLFDIVVDTVNYDALTVNGNEGDDTFVLNLVGAGGAAAGALPIELTLNGGPPNASDTLAIVGNAALPDIFTITPGADSQSGTAEIGGTDVGTTSFTGIEDITLDGGGGAGTDGLILNGTGADNAFTLAGTAALAGSARVDAGPNITFTALGSGGSDITLNGLGGSDSFDVSHFANWGLDDITLDGGPTPGDDSVVIRGADNVVDTIGYTASSENDAQLDITNATTVNYLLTDIEAAAVDAQEGAGNPTDVLNALNMPVSVTPTGFETGLVEPFNAGGLALLPLTYSNVEDANATGGAVAIQGTDGDDIIRVTAAGLVIVTDELGNTSTFDASAAASLVINALGGDDQIFIDGSALFAGGITVIGGDNGDGSDDLTVTGTAADNVIAVDLAASTATGVVGGPINFTGIENLTVNGGGAVAGDAFDITELGAVTGLERLFLNANGLAGDSVDIIGTAGDDRINFNPTDADTGLVTRDFTDLEIRYDNVAAAAPFVIQGGAGGFDVLHVVGTAGVDMITATATTVTRTDTVTVGAGIDRVDVTGGDSGDTIDLTLLGVVPTIIYGNDGNDTITGTAQADTVYGGAGNDVITTLAGADVIYGEEGNDTATGGTGADSFFGGDGSDTFIWNQGDGSDLVEGGAGESDILIFNGAAVVENFTLNAVGTRVELLRVQGGIDMDLAGVEQVDINSLAGADTFVVNDLHQTDLRVLNIDLGAGDADTVTVEGRTVDDNLAISTSGAGAVSVDGLRYDINLTTAELADTLTVNGNEGNDVIRVAAGTEGVIGLALNGDAGDDTLDASATVFNAAADVDLNGGDGNDTLIGGAGDETMDGGGGDDVFIGNGGTDAVGGGGAGLIGDTILVPGTPGDDVIDVTLNPAGHLLVTINGVTTTYTNFIGGPIATAGVERIEVNGVGGVDRLTVDSTNGAIPIAISYDGGPDADLLVLTGGVATSDVYSPGPNPGQGLSTIVIGGVTQTVSFQNIEPVIDFVGGPLVVNANNADNAINYTAGPNSGVVNAFNPLGLVTGQVSIDVLETIEFANKTTLTINALAGSDTINLNNPTTPAGPLTGITVNGGDPTASDHVIVNGTAAANAITVSTFTNDGAVVTGAQPVPVTVATAEHLTIDGQGGNDTLTVTVADNDEVEYTPDVYEDAGRFDISNSGFGPFQQRLPLSFEDLGAGGSLTVASVSGARNLDLRVLGTQIDDRFDVTAAGVVQAFKLGTGFFVTLPINAPGADELFLEGLDGDDVFDIVGNHPFLAGIRVAGGNPGASDVLNFTGSGAGVVTVDLQAQTVTEAGFGPVTISGIETLNLDAGGVGPTIMGTNGDDDVTVMVSGAGAGTVLIDFAVQQAGQVDPALTPPVINYSNIGADPANIVTFDLGLGNDTLIVVGNALPQTFTANVPAGTVEIDDGPVVGNDGRISFANTESLELFGLEGSDTFNVTPGAIPVFVDGGDPIGVFPGGDLLVVAMAIFFPGPENDEGAAVLPGNAPVSFDHIESIIVPPMPGGCPILIVGTNGDDDITVIARDASYIIPPMVVPPGLDGVQDFTVTVNQGPEILFIDAPDLYIDALSGDDDIVIRTRAPNGADWDMDVRIVGGPPSAATGDQGDVVEVETPNPAAGQPSDSVIYTPNGSDTGVMVIDENGNGIYDVAATDTQIQILSMFTLDCLPLLIPDGIPDYISSPGGAEALIYDGEGSNDNFRVNAPAGATDDTIVHTPGQAFDEGSIRVNSLLGVTYQNLGATATLTVDGTANAPGGAGDRLVVEGTVHSDTFTVANNAVAATSGAVTLNDSIFTRLAIRQIGVENLVLNGLEGDDDFIINQTQPYTSVTVHGGGPGNSDTLTINGAAATAETFTVTPGVIRGEGAVLVNAVNTPYIGIEHLFLAGNAGDVDNITINDDKRDNVWSVSAGTIGDLVQIDGRESIDINTFNDVTLTNTFGTDLFLVSPSNLVSFAGVFTVNGDAALPLDDVLQLLGTPGDDVVTSSATAVTVNGVAITAGANLVEVNVTTLGGADNIDLDLALAGVRKVVDSGDGADTINLAGIAAAGDVYIFAGDGDDNVTGSPQVDLIYGGRGNDVLIGAGGADTIYGEEGNDIFGNPSAAANGVADDAGNDRFFGGSGSDTFVWEPGDGSDTIEGGSEEADVLIFFGGAGDEVFNVFANLTNPARSVLFRNTGSITMDMAGIDQINVHGQGGRDEFVIGRANNGDSGADTAPTSPYTDPTASLSPLNTTEVRVVNVDLGAGDAGEDVFVDGQALDDNLLVSLESAATSVVRVSGLPYDVRILNSTVDDRLTVRGNEGDDVIKSVNPSGGGALNVESVIGITLAGGAGDDYLSADAILIGGIGDDFLEGGAGDDMFFGNQGEDTMVGGTGNDTYDGGPDFDTILIRGTSANDTIDVAQTNATTLQYNITGAIGGAGTETDTLVLLGGVRTVEEARVEAGRGADTIRLAVADALHNDGALNALRMTVVGGDDGGFDRVAVVDTGAADLSILRQSHDLQDGSVEVGPSFTAATEESFQHLYSEIEFIQVVDAAGANVETGVAGGSRLVVFKFDPYELNNDRNNAMHLGANSTVNGSATIDPGIGAFGLPADTDWYRVEAVVTGTIDFQIIFEQIGPGRIGLPNAGDLNINVRDSSGDVIANFTTSDDNDDNERVRIPAVQGEIYFFQVLGDGAAINAYDISVINLPSPVPYDLELDDEPVGDVPPANNSDTGRNDNDNITRDNTPTIVFRLDDAFFLNDIPGNDAAGNPLGDAPIPIPFRAGPAQPNQPGYAIAIFDEGDTPGGPNNVPPQTPLGFATMVEPGVYEFTTPVLADGSHFLTARVQLLDPATPLRTGFGARSQSLEIFVDTVPPPVSFGDPAVADDGLLPDSDVGVLPPNPDTIDDNVTSDVTPSFWGRAEANTIIRVFADANNNGTFEPGVDVFVGQTVAIPLDGNEQEPDGYWSLDSVINFNDEDLFPLDGLRTVFITAEDVAGNVRGDDPAELTLFRFFLDTQGPKVDGVFITNTTLIGLTTGNTLVRFDSTAPGVIQGTATITGLQAGDTVVGIDVRPANGLLYAVVDGGASDRIYTVNPITGVATLASTLSVALAGTRFGVDFNPVADRLRIVSDADQNLRVDVTTGTAVADGALNPANPNVVAAAYTNSNAGATSTTLYTIDSTTDVLNIQDPPNAGTQVLVGNLGFNVNDVSGFDIASGTNLAFASFVFGGVSSLYRINLTTGAATPVGNIGAGNGTPLVGLAAVPAFDLFDPKPTPAPTPLVNSLTVKLTDPPNRLAAPFNLPALKPETVNVDNFQLVGDHNGIVAIQAVTLTQSIMNGVAMANVELTFFEPLLDDRYTLYVLDNITDQVGNRLDGESNANEPQETPVFPSGNGIPGSSFVARFTVDSRPEVAVNSGGRSIFVDTNGNGVFDPRNDKDFTDRDIVYRFGFPTDDVFIGNFATNFGAVADGYDKLAAYGNIGGSFRFLIDTNNDGVPEPIPGFPVSTSSINAKPVSGNFDGNADNGDEVGLFDGARWYLDTNHNFNIDAAEAVGIASPIRGAGFVGDFDGDGAEDLATFNDFRNRFEIDLAANGYGGIDRVLIFGFPGTNERPVAADYNQDGIDDIGLYVPQQGAATPDEQAFFHILVSQPGPNGAPQPLWLSNRATALAIPADLVGILPAVANAAVEIHFRPEPFGDDLLLTFGEDFGLPLFGNFDPPVAAGGGTIDTPVGEGQSDTNPANNLDVNADGIVSTADLLPIIDDQRANDGRPHQAFKDDTAPYLDVNDDGLVSISDLLPIIQYLRDQPSEGEGEGEAPEFEEALVALSELVVTASITDNAASSEPALAASEEFIGLYLTSQRDETSLAAVLNDGLDAPTLGVALLDELAADVVAASGADLSDVSLALSDEKDGDEFEDSLDAVVADLLRVKSQS